jgi:hypothetical protein
VNDAPVIEIVERPVKMITVVDNTPVIKTEPITVTAKPPVTSNATNSTQEGYGLGADRLRVVGEQIKQDIKTVTAKSLSDIEKAKAAPVTVPAPVTKKTKKPSGKKDTGANYSRQMWDGKVYDKDGKPVTKHHSYKHGKPVMKEMSWGDFGTLNRVYRGKLEKAKPAKKPEIQNWLDYIAEVKKAFDNFKK